MFSICYVWTIGAGQSDIFRSELAKLLLRRALKSIWIILFPGIFILPIVTCTHTISIITIKLNMGSRNISVGYIKLHILLLCLESDW